MLEFSVAEPYGLFHGKSGEDGVCDVLLSQHSVFPSQAILV